MTPTPRRSKRWQAQPVISPEAAAALHEYPALVAQLLFNRGIHSAPEAAAFFDEKVPTRNLLSAPTLTGLAPAVARIERAVHDHERIAVYGDYDADGVTATALLVEYLRRSGAEVLAYIPDRMDEGYGLNREALRKLKESGHAVVITVDCGVRSLDEVAYGQSIGLDMIITDHHHVGAALPNAFAVLNPKQPDCPYPYKDFSGVGLAFKLAQGLFQSGVLGLPDPLPASADLVALGTVADMVPLTGENRALVRHGLLRMRQTPRPGVRALLAAAGGNRPRELNARTIGFALGPRLNAAGRLESALAAYDLLVTADPAVANRLAAALDQTNRERQELTRSTQTHARDLALAAGPNAPILIAAAPEFLPGIIGLAAGRLTEEFYRPAVVIAQGEEESRGSARSIPEFHITAALDACADLLVRYGGHAAAAGFTVRNENLPALIARLTSLAHAQLSALELVPTLVYDAETRLAELSHSVQRLLAQFEPCGYANPQPVFCCTRLRVRNARTVGSDNKHLKLSLLDERNAAWDAIGFNLGDWLAGLPPVLDILAHLEINEWQGEQRLQLNLLDLRPSAV